MSATVYGAGTYGAADEVASTMNLYVKSVSMNTLSQQAWLQNHIGEDVGLSIYNKGADMDFQGFLSTADNLGMAVGDAIQAAAIANAAIFQSSSGVTVFYVLDGNITRNATGFQEGSIKMTGRNGLTDTSATTVN